MRRLVFFALVVLAAACSGTSTQEQTLAAQNTQLASQMAVIRTTATVEADHILITVEHVQTEVQRVENEGTSLASTLVARGTAPASLPTIDVQAGSALPPSTATPPPSLSLLNATEETSAGVVTSVPLSGTQASVPRLSNIVMSTGVGKNDCAIDTVTQFPSNAEKIYVVATASNVPAGTLITAHWQNGGNEVAKFDFTPKNDIQQACIWFFIDQTDTKFTPGVWSVSLEINHTPVGAPIQFQIVAAQQ
jgi:hypothetical protein